MVDTESLSTGLYFVRLRVRDMVRTLRVVKR